VGSWPAGTEGLDYSLSKNESALPTYPPGSELRGVLTSKSPKVLSEKLTLWGFRLP
jgi:hypothetical protein